MSAACLGQRNKNSSPDAKYRTLRRPESRFDLGRNAKFAARNRGGVQCGILAAMINYSTPEPGIRARPARPDAIAGRRPG